jgi:hypothetical protein
MAHTLDRQNATWCLWKNSWNVWHSKHTLVILRYAVLSFYQQHMPPREAHTVLERFLACVSLFQHCWRGAQHSQEKVWSKHAGSNWLWITPRLSWNQASPQGLSESSIMQWQQTHQKPHRLKYATHETKANTLIVVLQHSFIYQKLDFKTIWGFCGISWIRSNSLFVRICFRGICVQAKLFWSSLWEMSCSLDMTQPH